jgi:hypothetical protein
MARCIMYLTGTPEPAIIAVQSAVVRLSLRVAQTSLLVACLQLGVL